MYKLYQMRLTEAEVNQVNKTGHDSVPKQKLHLDLQFDKGNFSAIVAEGFDKGYFRHVANITATNLENVFEVGNMGPEENIDRLLPMHSVSVGDVVEDLDGTKHLVANIGFKKVDETVFA